MHIKSLAVLEDLAENDELIRDILNDFTLGRKAASARIFNLTEYQVSEKLVRTYRETRTDPKGLESIDKSYQYYINGEPTSLSFEPIGKPIRYNEYLTVTNDRPKSSIGKAPKSKTIVIMPDVQAPLHDKELVSKFVSFLKDYQPTELAQVGDFTDSTEISRWVRGKKPEFAGDLQAGFDSAISIQKDIREVFDGRFRIVRSNHDDRLELYIQGCSPGAATLRTNTIEYQLEFDKYGIEFVRDGVVELVKDEWIMGHGDEGSLSPQAGKTAFGLAKNKFGVNVVCGHTHRAGMTSESYGYNGKVARNLTGLEVGHFMDIKQAQYLDKKGGAANWQQAFGILEIINGKTFPHLIPVNNGFFSVNGVLY
jgi:hypothetical protein